MKSNRWIRAFATGLLLVASTVMAASSHLIEGTVMGTRPGNLFMMARNGDHLEIAVPSSARVMRNGESASLEAIQPQDFVAVQLSDDKSTATEVVARTPY